VVDFAGIDSVAGCVVLTIADHLSWDDPGHLHALEEEFNRYLSFLESGAVFSVYPDACGRGIRVDLICKHALDARALAFLERARTVLERIGAGFEWRQLAGDLS
jgi:hypothetical protein